MIRELFTGFHELRTVLVFLLVFLALTFLSKKFSRNPRWVALSKKLPGPPVLPIVGNCFHLIVGAKDGMGPLLCEYAAKYGSTFRMWLRNHLVVVFTDPEDIEAVLHSSNCLRVTETILHFKEYFGNSLPGADPVPIWRQKRKAYQPFFTKNHSLSQIAVMNHQIYKYIDKMKTLVDGPETDWKHMTDNLALTIVARMYLTLNENDEMDELDSLTKGLIQVMTVYSASALFNWPKLVGVLKWFLPVDINDIHKSVQKCVNGMVDFNTKQAEILAEQGAEDKRVNSDAVQSYIRALQNIQKEVGEDDLVYSEIMALLVAGSETTGTTIAGCLFCLAVHQEIQQKVYEEIYQVFGEDDRPAEKSDLENFKYLYQVIKETQRLFTLFPAVARQPDVDVKIGTIYSASSLKENALNSDTTISFLGPHIYPPGTSFMINIAGIHHNPKIYPNPYSFNPDNFSPEAVNSRHRFTFIPFSSGSRNCIGKNLAETSLQFMLIAFLRTFSFHTTKKIEDIKLKPRLIESSASGYPMSIKLRKKLKT